MLLRQNQKHVMLSYEWERQKLVVKVYDYLVGKNIPLWMDIKAGVSSDNLYEGIAEAIENSSCFVCFMTQNYQDSDFCKQELQYAKQCKIPIIPLKLEENWNPKSWLGFITAGLLWLDFYHINNFEKKAVQLYSRICSAIGKPFSLEDSNLSQPLENTRSIRSQSIVASNTRRLNRRTKNDNAIVSNRHSNHNYRRRRSPPTTPISDTYISSPILRNLSNADEDEDKDDAKMGVRVRVAKSSYRPED